MEKDIYPQGTSGVGRVADGLLMVAEGSEWVCEDGEYTSRYARIREYNMGIDWTLRLRRDVINVDKPR